MNKLKVHQHGILVSHFPFVSLLSIEWTNSEVEPDRWGTLLIRIESIWNTPPYSSGEIQQLYKLRQYKPID